ncbi:MAG TPA: biotin-independent malonate decarboxylase subunit gamma, partial [Acidaminococcaceae bacterium]|nr:biotin-independent malonate decarboxylase subunit gamma [Acidaminococcaceae bacterium]
ILGEERGGRTHRIPAIKKLDEEFAAVSDKYINA